MPELSTAYPGSPALESPIRLYLYRDNLLIPEPSARREMGCSMDRVAKPTDRAAGPVSPQQQFRVRLLPEGLPGLPAKTLADVLPAIKVQRERKK